MRLWVFLFYKNGIKRTCLCKPTCNSLKCKLLGAGTQHHSLLGPIVMSREEPQTQAVIETLLLLLFSGWQPRWFLLCGGILSYYDSPEDAWKGCKGSIQMAVCEIQGEKPRELQAFFFCLPHQNNILKNPLVSASLSLKLL